MTSKQTFLPKSLHTVTAIRRLAEHIRLSDTLPHQQAPVSIDYAVERALAILGLRELPDQYGLAGVVRAQMAAALQTVERDAALAECVAEMDRAGRKVLGLSERVERELAAGDWIPDEEAAR